MEIVIVFQNTLLPKVIPLSILGIWMSTIAVDVNMNALRDIVNITKTIYTAFI